MDRKPINSGRRLDDRAASQHVDVGAKASPRRIDRLAEVVDHCTEAKRLADALDEKLLSYLLAMAIQETRAAMRQEVAAAAGAVRGAPRAAKPRRAPSAG